MPELDITQQSYWTAAYPNQAPDAPEEKPVCRECGHTLTEDEFDWNGDVCNQCLSEMEYDVPEFCDCGNELITENELGIGKCEDCINEMEECEDGNQFSNNIKRIAG